MLAGLIAGIVATGFAFTILPTAFIPDEDHGLWHWEFSNYRTGLPWWKPKSSGCKSPKFSVKKTMSPNASIINGYGFNGSSPDQGIFFFGLQALRGAQGRRTQFRRDRKTPQCEVNPIKRLALPRLLAHQRFLASPPKEVSTSSSTISVIGAYSFNDLSNLAGQLIKTANASGDFSNVYTQFTPSAPAIGLNINREVMGALNVDFKEAMDTIAALWPATTSPDSPTRVAKFATSTFRARRIRETKHRGHS